MSFGKSSPFLAFSILVLCQAGGLQASPLRWALDSLPDPDPAALSDKEGRLLLASLVRAYEQRSTNDEPDLENSVTAQKRNCKVPSCATGDLAHKVHKYGNKDPSVNTYVGPYSYGRRRRDLQA